MKNNPDHHFEQTNFCHRQIFNRANQASFQLHENTSGIEKSKLHYHYNGSQLHGKFRQEQKKPFQLEAKSLRKFVQPNPITFKLIDKFKPQQY